MRARERSSETGAALLSVLMIVAVMSVAAVLALDGLSRAIDVSRLSAARGEVHWHARSVRAFSDHLAVGIVQQTDGALTATTPGLGETVEFPVEGGRIRARLEEASNCFNLNALAERGDGGWTVRPERLRDLERLFEAAELSPYLAEGLAASIADWIDSDTLARPGGAEDGFYAALETPHRAAGTLFANTSELRALAPVTPELFAAIAPLVCVRPSSEPSVLNLNTLRPDQAPLVSALYAPALETPTARALISQRPAGGWREIAAFTSLPEITVLPAGETRPEAIALASTHVRVRADISLMEAGTRMTLIYRLDPQDGPGLVAWQMGDG